jgi:hypothetical protein
LSSYPLYPGGLDNLVFDFVLGPLHLARGSRSEAVVLAPLVVLAALGIGKIGRPGLRSILSGSAIAFLALAYAGRWLGMEGAQPYRFVIPLGGVLAIAAGPAADWLSDTRPARRRAALVVATLALLFVVDRLRITRESGDYLGAGLGPTETWALDALRAAASPDGRAVEGRVLLEGDWLSDPVPGRPGARRVSYSFVGFEEALEGQFIGAPIMSTLTPQDLASFWRGRLFGRNFGDYDRESFLRLCDLYDIRWAVTLHEPSRRKMESFGPGFDPIAQKGGIGIFRIDGSRSGQRMATDRSGGGTIELTADSTAAAVLPYHWNPLLVARPAAELRPAPTGIDPELQLVEIVPPAPGRYEIGFEP